MCVPKIRIVVNGRREECFEELKSKVQDEEDVFEEEEKEIEEETKKGEITVQDLSEIIEDSRCVNVSVCLFFLLFNQENYVSNKS